MINPAMDCASSAFQPYPQFYAYQLLADPNYLGLSSGGTMAKSITLSTAMHNAKLVATAFFTGSKNAVVLVNPTGTDISTSVAATNPGFASPQATLYILNATSQPPSSQSLPLTTVIEGVQTNVTVPAFSVAAISITNQ
jgi:hypothetical protein